MDVTAVDEVSGELGLLKRLSRKRVLTMKIKKMPLKSFWQFPLA